MGYYKNNRKVGYGYYINNKGFSYVINNKETDYLNSNTFISDKYFNLKIIQKLGTND